MRDDVLAVNRGAAVAVWPAGLFTGGIASVVLLVLVWDNRGSLVRRHALVASAFFVCASLVIFPFFFFALLVPAFYGRGPSAWSTVLFLLLGLATWVVTGVGASIAFRDGEHGGGSTPETQGRGIPRS